MSIIRDTLASVEAGRGAALLPRQAIYAEAIRRLAMHPSTPGGWLEAALGAEEALTQSLPGDREAATAVFLGRAVELFGSALDVVGAQFREDPR